MICARLLTPNEGAARRRVGLERGAESRRRRRARWRRRVRATARARRRRPCAGGGLRRVERSARAVRGRRRRLRRVERAARHGFSGRRRCRCRRRRGRGLALEGGQLRLQRLHFCKQRRLLGGLVGHVDVVGLVVRVAGGGLECCTNGPLSSAAQALVAPVLRNWAGSRGATAPGSKREGSFCRVRGRGSRAARSRRRLLRRVGAERAVAALTPRPSAQFCC